MHTNVTKLSKMDTWVAQPVNDNHTLRCVVHLPMISHDTRINEIKCYVTVETRRVCCYL